MDPTGAGRQRGFRAPGAGGPEGPDTIDTRPSGEPDPSPTTGTGEGPGRGRTASWRWLVAAGAVLVVAMAVIGTLAFRLGSTSAALDAQSPSPSPTPRPSATPLPTTDLYRQVVPSVVLITTAKGALGTGTVVTDKGLVLTANHVVADGGAVTVVFADGTRSPAKVASTNPKNDTATLTPQKLPEVVVPVALGGGTAVGTDVVAIGNPLGLQDSTTTGVVSGLGRTSRTETGTVKGLIQFDAAVNPGSSGGPLLDRQGLLVGVVISIADPGKDEAWAGIGFAVPIGSALGGGGDGPGPGGGPQI
ncbi:S1C family serine protease [Microlunatus flavus]|uniref:Trypsin-like peptidase domain-containing protein n=1 Tax=Microlunatus flavus TaxID=1036181 RepID=A0A1H9M3Q2_9ACTN|nr:trypsin-like peptidase domain-containing protein [Microlunatus flavus]SER17733.1 Trypsin-like peptidase domain-containing protein [Microlunatus flavus]